MHPVMQEHLLRQYHHHQQQQQQQSAFSGLSGMSLTAGMYPPTTAPYPSYPSGAAAASAATATVLPPTRFVRQVSPEAAAFAAAVRNHMASAPSWSDRYNSSLALANEVLRNATASVSVPVPVMPLTTALAAPSLAREISDTSVGVPMTAAAAPGNLCTDSLTDEDEEEEERAELAALHRLRSDRLAARAPTAAAAASRSLKRNRAVDSASSSLSARVAAQRRFRGAAAWNADIRRDLETAAASRSAPPQVVVPGNGPPPKRRRKVDPSSSTFVPKKTVVDYDLTVAAPSMPVLCRAVSDPKDLCVDAHNDAQEFEMEEVVEQSACPPTQFVRRVTDESADSSSSSSSNVCDSFELTTDEENDDDEEDASAVPTDALPEPRVLGNPEDKHWLSDLVCLVRENVEVFAATPEDVAARSRRGGIKKPIDVGRVGIRCKHCVNVDPDRKAKGAVSYPNSVRILHQAVRNWQRYHFNACKHIPDKVRDTFRALKSTRSHSGNASLKYWVESAKRLGLRDTNEENGIRFTDDVEREPDNSSEDRIQDSISLTSDEDDVVSSNSKNAAAFDSVDSAHVATTTTSAHVGGGSLVLPSEKPLVTDFLYLLLSQQQACRYKSVDRNGKRKFREVGFPGVECRHCARNAGAGRYFPLMVTTLANNNNPFNCTHSHMMKCRRCPDDVKRKLAEYQLTHVEQSERLPDGWKKAHFDRLWARLHGDAGATTKPQTTTTTETTQKPKLVVAVHDDSLDVVPARDDSLDEAALALSSFSAQAFREVEGHRVTL